MKSARYLQAKRSGRKGRESKGGRGREEREAEGGRGREGERGGGKRREGEGEGDRGERASIMTINSKIV